MHHGVTVILCVCLVAGMSSFGAAEQHMMQPRVPADKLAEARSLASPLPDSPETVEKGKALYNGKGTCVNCHGQSGAGDGPVAASLNPSPRNFQHHGFWRHRTEGEIFWVIKHGSPGTSMIGFGGVLTTRRSGRSFSTSSASPENMDQDAEWGLAAVWAGWDPEALDVVPIKTLNHELAGTVAFCVRHSIRQTWNAP